VFALLTPIAFHAVPISHDTVAHHCRHVPYSVHRLRAPALILLLKIVHVLLEVPFQPYGLRGTAVMTGEPSGLRRFVPVTVEG